MRGLHICSFSTGLEDLPRKKQADISEVLRVMKENGRFSCFEASANPTIAKTMDRIMQEGFAKSVGGAYPWTEVEITEKGEKAIQGLFWHGPEEDPLKDFVLIGKRTYVPLKDFEAFIAKRKRTTV